MPSLGGIERGERLDLGPHVNQLLLQKEEVGDGCLLDNLLAIDDNVGARRGVGVLDRGRDVEVACQERRHLLEHLRHLHLDQLRFGRQLFALLVLWLIRPRDAGEQIGFLEQVIEVRLLALGVGLDCLPNRDNLR